MSIESLDTLTELAFQVNQKDLDKGIEGDCRRCAVALGVLRALGDHGRFRVAVSVGVIEIEDTQDLRERPGVHSYWMAKHPNSAEFGTTDELNQYIMTFDRAVKGARRPRKFVVQRSGYAEMIEEIHNQAQ